MCLRQYLQKNEISDFQFQLLALFMSVTGLTCGLCDAAGDVFGQTLGDWADVDAKRPQLYVIIDLVILALVVAMLLVLTLIEFSQFSRILGIIAGVLQFWLGSL